MFKKIKNYFYLLKLKYLENIKYYSKTKLDKSHKNLIGEKVTLTKKYQRWLRKNAVTLGIPNHVFSFQKGIIIDVKYNYEDNISLKLNNNEWVGIKNVQIDFKS